MVLGMRRRLLATAAGGRGSRTAAAAAGKDEAEAAVDPLRHFRGFRSMDEYVGVTLVKYDNRSDDSTHEDASGDDGDAAGDGKQRGEQ